MSISLFSFDLLLLRTQILGRTHDHLFKLQTFQLRLKLFNLQNKAETITNPLQGSTRFIALLVRCQGFDELSFKLFFVEFPVVIFDFVYFFIC